MDEETKTTPPPAKKHKKEEVHLYNMVMLEKEDGQVLVLDKVKHYGWEGLTFPGGKVEPGESLVDSARRETQEETGYKVGDLDFCGCIHWYVEGRNQRDLGLLYKTKDFSGHLVSSQEGDLAWMGYDELKAMEPKSDSMNEILDIYEGKVKEVIITYKKGGKVRVEYFS